MGSLESKEKEDEKKKKKKNHFDLESTWATLHILVGICLCNLSDSFELLEVVTFLSKLSMMFFFLFFIFNFETC